MLDNIIKIIESYRNSNDNRPLIVDVDSTDSLNYLLSQYINLKMIDFSKINNNDDVLPTIFDLYNELSIIDAGEVIVKSITPYLKLMGEEFIRNEIHRLLSTTFNKKVILITFQCSKYINESDPRFKNKIVCNSFFHENHYTVIFIPNEIKEKIKPYNGVKSILTLCESSLVSKIYINTRFEKKDFAKSLYKIEECKSSYDLLCLIDNNTNKLNRNYGSNDEWEYLLNNIVDNSIEKTITQKINCNNFIYQIENWTNCDSRERWLLFICLKLKEIKTGNWAVDYAIAHSKNSNDFLPEIFNSILKVDPREQYYWNKYNDRKYILKKINVDSYSFCEQLAPYKEKAIFYLTDNTDYEKKKIIEFLVEYNLTFKKSQLMEILSKVYKDLYNYLSYYNLGSDLLNDYFNEYKYLKITNRLTPSFKNKVDIEAVERSYNKYLMYRNEKLSEIDFNDSFVYFIDALGVEFLSFIEKKCSEKGLSIKTNICKATLPTITECNTDFRDFFEKKGVEIIDEDRVDKIKHSGLNDFDFGKNKLPIYIIEELKIIEECLENIKKKIKSNLIKKVVIVSDHGATRLAILNDDLVKEDVESVGEHGGRVCKYIPGIKEIPNAIQNGDYYVLADYNSFKGGRLGKVEMHGGATLEEVSVPIIEITERISDISIKVFENPIKVSFKKAAHLIFTSSNRLSNVKIIINGKTYNVISEDGFSFEVFLDDIKKIGKYSFDVWSNDNLVSVDNYFEVEKESAKNVDLWGD